MCSFCAQARVRVDNKKLGCIIAQGNAGLFLLSLESCLAHRNRLESFEVHLHMYVHAV